MHGHRPIGLSWTRPKLFLFPPHSNADSEYVLSMVNVIIMEHRADLAQDSIAALLSVNICTLHAGFRLFVTKNCSIPICVCLIISK